MLRRRKGVDPAKRAQVLAEARQQKAGREKSYREQALALFPHVCARCGKEYSGAELRELTVHHKDSDHMNNPPDGSNWELLCLYCHDDEHGIREQRGHYDPKGPEASSGPALGHNPFEGLGGLSMPEKHEGDN